THFAATLRLRPAFAPAEYNVGTALLMLGRGADAIGHFSNALVIDPNYALAHQSLGAAFDLDNRRQEAADHYLTASAIMAAATEPAAAGEAVRLAERAIALLADPPAKAFDTLAAAYAAAGELDRAVETAERARDLASGEGNAALVAAIEKRLDSYRKLVGR